MVLEEHKLDFGLLYLVDDLISAVPKLAESIKTDADIGLNWDTIESQMHCFEKHF
jgi:hypothetical protein